MLKQTGKNLLYKSTAILILVIVFFVMAPLVTNIPPAEAAAMVPFGGKILFFSPPFVTAYVNCPPLVAVANYGGPYKGILYLLIPPGQPRLNYNYFTSGVSVLGSFFPSPIPINCIFQPIFPAVYFGTSLR
jgi:hypothetical protein